MQAAHFSVLQMRSTLRAMTRTMLEDLRLVEDPERSTSFMLLC